MTPLRVLHAIRSDGFAGVEHHVATLAAAQRALGHRVAVIGGDPSLMRAAIGDPAIPLRGAVTVGDTARAIDSWRRCDVLHVHMTAAEIAAVLAVRSWRVPVVSTRHFGGRRGASLGGRLAAPFVERRISAQIAISGYVAGLIGGPSTVVHHGVPSTSASASAAGRTPTVLVAQRLEREKDTDVAVRAFAIARLAERGWELHIAGEGSDRAHLERLARHLGVVGSVRFLGRRSDVTTLMEHAGLFLATCPVEGLGLAVLEAMAAGLPVVAARAGGHLETVGAVPGAALFDPGDAGHAGRLLARLADDVEERERYGARLQALQRERFTVEAQARATDAVYRTVL
ncbi:MAG TPA: glycosyltransferase family 4 protein [Pengzhenrongella sp.]